MPKKDLNQLAKAIVDQATGETSPLPKTTGGHLKEKKPPKSATRKPRAAPALVKK
jgi:hypothetical protein